jgi:hypothetical protein
MQSITSISARVDKNIATEIERIPFNGNLREKNIASFHVPIIFHENLKIRTTGGLPRSSLAKL